MNENATRYPLSWPAGWKRTPTNLRRRATFGTKRPGEWKREMTPATAVGRLSTELTRLGAEPGTEVLSTNLILRLDGLPRSDQREPDDPGAAVYFQLMGKPMVLACDKWTRVADNITAIAAHIEAIRAVDRYGVGSLEQAFAGYAALPADTAANWRAVFGFAADSQPSADEVDRAFKRAARDRHPDRGGTDLDMAHLNRAREYAFLELKV